MLPVVLYGCETWSLTLREEHRRVVFENTVLRRIFGPKRGDVTGEWRKLHNEKLHILYLSPNIITQIKSRRMRWPGHVVRMGEECGDEPSGSCATELVRNHYYHGNAYNNKHIHTYYPIRPKIPKLQMIPNQHFLTVYIDQKSSVTLLLSLDIFYSTLISGICSHLNQHKITIHNYCYSGRKIIASFVDRYS
jgi:hypothetical protein